MNEYAMEDWGYDDEFHPEFDEFDRDLFGGADCLAEALGEILNDDYADASLDELHDVLEDLESTMTPAEAFNFRKALRAVTKTGAQVLKDPVVGQIASTALPIAGGALGTMIGGPVGTMVGAQLGQAAGGALTAYQQSQGVGQPQQTVAQPAAAPQAAPQVVAQAAPQTTMVAAQPVAAAPNVAGSQAAAQMLQLLQNPAVQRGLIALSMGAQAKQTVRAGEAEVPVSAVMHMLSGLTSRAAMDAERYSVPMSMETGAEDALGGMAAPPPFDMPAQDLYGALQADEAIRLEYEAEAYLDGL